IKDQYRGADGTNVPREQWFHPDKALLPPPLSGEKKEAARKIMEENPEIVRAWREKMMKRESGGCGLEI
ncbi:hypothetical protein AOQ84DRAFT_272037, partial [Glonium stellatum]